MVFADRSVCCMRFGISMFNLGSLSMGNLSANCMVQINNSINYASNNQHFICIVKKENSK